MRDATVLEREKLEAGQCPFCGNGLLVPGPRGGLALNVSCLLCKATFNIGPIPMLNHRLLVAQVLE